MSDLPTILTGIRSNENPTLGNYFGAIKPLIDMAQTRSDGYRVNIFVPDLHSFTTPINHGDLYEKTLSAIRLFVAAGLPIDDPNVAMYRQSYISAHSELTWILDCFTGFGEMRRMTQFKEKSTDKDLSKFSSSDAISKNETQRVAQELSRPDSVGLFNYPVLMAADILLYNASYIPVGDDQTQHLEFARDISERMNNRFGKLFVVPESVKKQHEFFGNEHGLRIMDLANPTKKMSKSDSTGKGVIFLDDAPAIAAKKVMSAETDTVGKIHFDREKQPGISNLLEILSLLRDRPIEETIAEFEGQTRYGDFKKIVAGEVENFLDNLQGELAAVDNESMMAHLEKSEAEMNKVAKQTLRTVQQAVGLRSRDI